MTAADHVRLVRRLAALAGIERSYRAIGGARVVAGAQAEAAILGALGYPVDSDAAIADAIAARGADTDRLVAPVSVLRPAAAARLTLGAVGTGALRAGSLHLRDESGVLVTVPLRRLPATRRADGRWTVDLGSLDLAVGYYAATVETPRRTAHSQILVRPGRAARPRRSFGVFAPLYGLRSAGDWGIGSTGELARLARWAAHNGASYVATLPLYPAFYDRARFEVSPYRPVSRVAWNELYLDPATLPEVAASREAADLLSSPRLRRAVGAARGSATVEYAKVFPIKRAVIAACAAAVSRGPRRSAFAAFCASRPESAAYARFRAEREGGPPAERRSAVRYHEYGQFAMDAALAEVVRDGAPLYLDLPLGVHPGGFDPAHYRSAFIGGVAMGAPPDDFYATGQNWGIPPLDPEAIRNGELAYPITTYRHLLRFAGVARIDHVMGFERCFVIPDGADPGDGAYLRYPSNELRAIAAIEAERAGVTLVGEDLGTVAPETRAAMRRDGMLHSAVYEMEASAADPTPATIAGSCASVGTHDLPRFATFITGSDLAGRIRSGAMSATEVAAEQERRRALRRALSAGGGAERGVAAAYRGVLGWLGSTSADLALVDLGDLVGDPEPENRPGPDSGETSWRHRLPVTLEELEGGTLFADRLGVVASGRRAPTSPIGTGR